MPDINSLLTSPSPNGTSPLNASRPRRISLNHIERGNGPPSPRSPPLSSLQAAATINRGLQRSPGSNSPVRSMHGLERRRSSLMNNLIINDPTVPAPGELQQSSSNQSSPRSARRSFVMATADPHHHRQPSLGELHQELENEQEAQVNRLLQMIRLQQDQLATLQRQQQSHEPSPTSSEQSHFQTPPSTIHTPASTVPTEPIYSRPGSISGLPPVAPHAGHFNRPHSLSRQSSSRLSNAGQSPRALSPAIRPTSSGLGPHTEDFLLGGGRDECAFYQAETQTLTRENQMLKSRIRELERQISDAGTTNPAATVSGTMMPVPSSPLASPPATSTSQEAPALSAAAEPITQTE
ncbi:hypothetical protein LTR78_008503 [Recurvomyces mirabilis]|uniref:Uncharacterized protein n=1 Tax=Recurvomyces mirabilis TaxID=574656 RepID=A0AAE0WGX8_9PEZI|nr:hypothetical protein LTR78_008503 [Recurvomyces mirabilis]KAK5156255.1 hypothetical protein LTS14_005142 [Recurvomyces mirabilis]